MFFLKKYSTKSTNDINDIKSYFMSVLAYLSWLVLIPIFAAPKSQFTRFHANQGLVLALTEIVWWIVDGILSNILYAVFAYPLYGVYLLLNTALGFVNILFSVFAIIGILNALNGRTKELPLIGKFRILK